MDIILNNDSPTLDDEMKGCKGELMVHQSAAVRAIIDVESESKHNRYVVRLELGAGKTRLALGLIMASPRPPIVPVKFVMGRIEHTITPDSAAIIDPTIVVVRPSVFNQWMCEIGAFTNLRVFKVENSRTLIKFIGAVRDGTINSYDMVLVCYKNVSGSMDSILSDCPHILPHNKNGSKRIHNVITNLLPGKYIRRIIYDDWDSMNSRLFYFETSGHVMYLSATTHGGKMFYGDETCGDLDTALTYKLYGMSARGKPIISCSRKFLNDSMFLGLESSASSMMPPEPRVFYYNVVSHDDLVISAIVDLSDDAHILESINSMANQSLGATIQSLLRSRYPEYRRCLKIIAHYEAMDLDDLASLPSPPPDTHFTAEDIWNMLPINYKFRTIRDRVKTAIAESRAHIDAEDKIIARVCARFSENECIICTDQISNSAVSIMKCCNIVLHVECVARCHSALGLCVCRSPIDDNSYTVIDPCVDINPLIAAASAGDMIGLLEEQKDVVVAPVPEEPSTKISILLSILRGDKTDRTEYRLNRLGSMVFDTNDERKCDETPAKVLIYSSADAAISKIEKDILAADIHCDHLTKNSATKNKNKIATFIGATDTTVIIANTWKDAAGIDFKMATDIIVVNYIESEAYLEQMFGRACRAGQTVRTNIHIIGYTNERSLWLRNYLGSK
jgi:hypothetical protein